MNYNRKVGNFGEGLAVEYLIKKGYKIVGRNIQMGQNEIDIIAEYKSFLVFVEVKTNTIKNSLAEDNMTKNKIKHFKRAISDFIHFKKISSDFIRPDLIAIDIDISTKIAKIKHFVDIF